VTQTPLFYHDVFNALSQAKVRFVVVGGVAVNLQGVPRFTADVDVAVATDSANLLLAGNALAGLGLVPRLPVPLSQLGEPERVREWIEQRNLQAFTLQDPQNPLRQVDLLLVSPLPYDDLERDAEPVNAGPLRILVASIPSLIKMKEATGREQDASDVEALQRILKLERE
jgi:hypothetical protein